MHDSEKILSISNTGMLKNVTNGKVFWLMPIDTIENLGDQIFEMVEIRKKD